MMYGYSSADGLEAEELAVGVLHSFVAFSVAILMKGLNFSS